MANPKAKEAMDKEWKKLRFHPRPNPKDKGMVAWDEDSVRELGKVKDEARRKGKKIDDAGIAEPCTQKNSELPDGHAEKI